MFDAAARHLNFRLAAEELNLTQGAVAQQVRRLESDLGLQLFYRNARGLTLTEVGVRYHRPIAKALAMIDDATHNLQSERNVITLSVTPSFASKWLVPRLADFSRKYPNVEVKTVASEGVANFQMDGIDLAVRQTHPPFGEELHVELLALLDLRAVCSPVYAKKMVAPVKQIEDFIGLQLIQDSHILWDRLFEEAELSAQNGILQFNQTSLAMDAAANGQGIALAPRILLNTDLEQGRLVELWRSKRSGEHGYYLVYPRHRLSYPARVALVQWVLLEVGKPESKRPDY